MGDTFNNIAKDNASVGMQIGKSEGPVQAGAGQAELLAVLADRVAELRASFGAALDGGTLRAGSSDSERVDAQLRRADETATREMSAAEKIRTFTEVINVVSPILATTPGRS
jgi:hypothetical protein